MGAWLGCDLTELQYYRLEEATQTLWLTLVLTPWAVRELSHAVRLRPTRRHNLDEHRSDFHLPNVSSPKCKATKYPPQWCGARHSREIAPYIAAFQLHDQGSVTCRDSAHSLVSKFSTCSRSEGWNGPRYAQQHERKGEGKLGDEEVGNVTKTRCSESELSLLPLIRFRRRGFRCPICPQFPKTPGGLTRHKLTYLKNPANNYNPPSFMPPSPSQSPSHTLQRTSRHIPQHPIIIHQFMTHPGAACGQCTLSIADTAACSIVNRPLLDQWLPH